MADSNSEYEKGTMPIKAQEGTFSGFMNGTIYGGALVAVVLIFPILLFAVGLSWLPSLVVTVIIGILLGVVLKLAAAWYASLFGLAIITAIFCTIFIDII